MNKMSLCYGSARGGAPAAEGSSLAGAGMTAVFEFGRTNIGIGPDSEFRRALLSVLESATQSAADPDARFIDLLLLPRHFFFAPVFAVREFASVCGKQAGRRARVGALFRRRKGRPRASKTWSRFALAVE